MPLGLPVVPEEKKIRPHAWEGTGAQAAGAPSNLISSTNKTSHALRRSAASRPFVVTTRLTLASEIAQPSSASVELHAIDVSHTPQSIIAYETHTAAMLFGSSMPTGSPVAMPCAF